MNQMKTIQIEIRLRHKLYNILETGNDPLATIFNRFLAAVIILAVALVIIETEQSFRIGNEIYFESFEYIFGTIFIIEYFSRLWIAAENQKFGPGIKGRIKYILSPWAIIDFLAILPMLLQGIAPFLYPIRLLRLLRVIKLLRMGPFAKALYFIKEAVTSRKYELAATICIGIFLLIISSVVMFLVEGSIPEQADNFGSIPRAMWWAVVTLTTIGYGDAYPVTAIGKFFAALTAVVGIGIIAAPTGILAAAFSDAINKEKDMQ